MKNRIGGILVGLSCLLAFTAHAENCGTMRGPVRGNLDVANPNVQNWVQASGNARINLTNRGFTGNDGPQMVAHMNDPCTGEWAPQCEFPLLSGQNYLFQAGLWIGAIIEDSGFAVPRVSVGTDGWLNPSINELWPGDGEAGDVTWGSNIMDATDCFGNNLYDPNARANFESIATFSDTLTDAFWVDVDPIDDRHEPLGLEVTQSVLTWTSPEFSNLFIIEYKLRNIGENFLRNLYLGFYTDADCGPFSQLEHHMDDISGFLRFDPLTGDTLNIGWSADNDGRPPQASTGPFDNPHSMGVMALSDATEVRTSFNWWISNEDINLDYGPSWTSYADRDSLEMGWCMNYGSAMGDLHKYQMLANGEQDFDQIYVDNPGWITANPQVSYDPICNQDLNESWSQSDPSIQAADLANGFDTRFMISWGPLGVFDYTEPNGCAVYRLNPGEEFSFTMGFLLGPDFHDPNNPQPSNTDIDPTLFDFTGLIESAHAARYLYEHNYENIVAPPEDFAPTSAGDGVMPLAWSTPSSGTVSHYEIWGIYSETPQDTAPMHAGPITGNSFTFQAFQNGEEWRMLIRTVDEEMFHSGFADTLVRVGAVLPVTNLRAETDGALVDLFWDASGDPALTSYTIARKSSAGDSTTFTSAVNSFTDNTAVNGRHYDYWVLTESSFGVTGLPSLSVHALPFEPQQEILLIGETYELAAIDPVRACIEPDSVHSVYADLLTTAGYTYDYIAQPEHETLVFGLETLAQYDIVIWYAESNHLISTAPPVAERELIFSDYTCAGGHMIRLGKRVLNSAMGIHTGHRMPPDYLCPLAFDSVLAATVTPMSDIRCIGATSLDERFPDLDLNPNRIAQQVWGSSVLDYLQGTELLWPRGDAWPLYAVEVQEGDSSGYEGEPCAVISEQIVLLDMPLYFVEHDDAVQFLQAAIEGFRNNSFDAPDAPTPALPSEVALQQNYPNPFNPTTTIAFSIPDAAHVSLIVYDIMGREVTTLVNKPMERGAHAVSFEANRLASGIYFYRLQTGSKFVTRKMVLLK